MCYPKPGPRCSAHASIQLLKAKAAYETYRGENFESNWALKQKIEEAEDEFYITPLGLKTLEEAVSRDSSDPRLRSRLEKYRTIRAERMAMLHINSNANSVAHPSLPKELLEEDFKDDQVIRKARSDAELYNLLMNESDPWLDSLTEDEVEQMRWMTDYGAMEANTHIAGNNTYRTLNGAFPPEDIDRRMVSIDSALAKYESNIPVITYRGVRKGMLPKAIQDNFWRIDKERIEEMILDSFPVGEVIVSKYYWPTSASPDRADRFADCGVILEIKTTKAAPISPVSALDQEHERLLPRDQQYKVINVLKDVPYGRVKRTVIQLENL